MTASSRGTAPGFSIGIERRTKGNSMSTAHHFRSAFVPHDLPEPRAGAAQGPLAGLTAAVKDMYDIAGLRTGGGGANRQVPDRQISRWQVSGWQIPAARRD